MTMSTTVAAIRRLLNDDPDETTTSASVSTTAATTVTVTDITKFATGQTWEFDDDSGELVLITAVADSTSTITMKRGHKDTTAATHSSGVVMMKEPRYYYDTVSQAVNYVLDSDLYSEGLFELQEHQVTSSATSDYYNAPAAGCLRFLDVYQKTSSMYEPKRSRLRYSEFPTNADSTLFANGKYFIIEGNYGTAGTDIYYVTCAHAMTITTLTTASQRIVELLGTAYLLEWTEPRRAQGPTNQGDTTVRTGTNIGTAAYYRSLAEELMAKEKRKTEELFPAKRRFVRN